MKRQDAGVTLVELAIVIAVVAILLALAGPSYRELMLNNRRATQINEMMASLNLARAEAVRRGTRVALCKGSAANGCEATEDGCCDDGTGVPEQGWEQGWYIFVDDDENSRLTSADGDELLRYRGALAEGTTLLGNTFYGDSISFNPQGYSTRAGTLTHCDSRGTNEARGITISNTGRARVITSGLTCPGAGERETGGE